MLFCKIFKNVGSVLYTKYCNRKTAIKFFNCYIFRRQSIQMVFDENEKSYENKRRSLEEKEREHHSKYVVIKKKADG